MSIPFLSHSSRAVYGTIVATAVLEPIVALGIWGGMAARQRGSTPSRVAGAAVISALIGVVIIILKTWH